MHRLSLLLACLCLALASQAQLQTMDFSSGASHPGFTFTNWNSNNSTIWNADLAQTAIISVDQGVFDLVSFDVGPFVGANTIRLTSDNGDTLIYDSSIPGTHTVNWTGITEIRHDRIAGAGASEDIDNVVVNVNAAGCNNPSPPTAVMGDTTICAGDSVSLSLFGGQLNDADHWAWHTGSCGGTVVDTGSAIIMQPSQTTTYYIGGEGGCIDSLVCLEFTVSVNPAPVMNQISLSDDTICYGDTLTMWVNGSLGGASNWQWYTGGCGDQQEGTGDTLTLVPGSSTAFYVAPIGCGGVQSCLEDSVFVEPSVPIPSINLIGSDTLQAAPVLPGYQWYLNGVAISGATGIQLAATDSGLYQVQGVASSGCVSVLSGGFSWSGNGTGIGQISMQHYRIWPNPVADQLSIEINRVEVRGFQLCDLHGRVVLAGNLTAGRNAVDVSQLPSGIYFLRFEGRAEAALINVVH